MSIREFLRNNPDIIYSFKPNDQGNHQLLITLRWEDKRDKEITKILRSQKRMYALHPLKGDFLGIFIW